MPQNSETPHAGGVSGKSCGGHFHENNTDCVSVTQELDPSRVFHVREFVPTANGLELEHRVGLLKARDWAAHYLANSDSYLARCLAHDAHSLAGQFVFMADVSIDRLNVASIACRRLVGAAMAVEHLHCEETPL